MTSTNEDFLIALRNSYKTKTKTEYNGFHVEFCDLSSTNPDVSSAFLSTTGTAATAASDMNNNAELDFARFLGEDCVNDPFILVSKESKLARAAVEKSQTPVVSPTEPRNNKVPSPRKKQAKSETGDSSGVWGSPLKWRIPSDDSSLDGDLLELSQLPALSKKRYPKRKGIPVNMARRFLSAFNQHFGESPEFPSLVVLCDSADLSSTAVFASKVTQVSHQGQMSKIFKTTMVTTDQKTSTDWNSKISLPGGKSPSCQAVYQISMPAEDGEEPWGAVAIEMTWEGASQLLESPPSNAKTIVRAFVTSGSMRSRMYKLYQELDLLQRIIASLSSGEMLWESDISDRPAVSLVTAVKNLINRLKQDGTMQQGGALHGHGETDEDVTFASTLKELSVPERNDFDFTDHLWKVLTDCQSTADLIDSLRLVFGALGRRELQPFVNQQNQTTVAKIVGESRTSRYSTPSLTGLQPLLFLAEMGAEKLRRDYINVFESQHLASPSLLAPFIGTEGELGAKLEHLQKLHATLEMVCLLSTTLHLPSDTLGSAAGQMLTHFTQHAVSPHCTHNFWLRTAEVQPVLTALQPIMWSAETHTAVAGDVRESNLYCLCASQPFLHISTHTGESVTEASESRNAGEAANDLGHDAGYCLVQRTETVVIL